MRDLLILLVHLIATLARLMGPGGLRSVVAESLLVKQQLLILNRSRHRAPNLRASDRILAGVCALFMRPDFNARAWDEMELTPEDCDVVFAYPWPNEEAFVDNVFRRHASANSLLLTFHDLGRVLVQRKVSHHTQLRTLGWM